MNNRLTAIICFSLQMVCLSGLGTAAYAADDQTGKVIENFWARVTPPGAYQGLDPVLWNKQFLDKRLGLPSGVFASKNQTQFKVHVTFVLGKLTGIDRFWLRSEEGELAKHVSAGLKGHAAKSRLADRAMGTLEQNVEWALIGGATRKAVIRTHFYRLDRRNPQNEAEPEQFLRVYIAHFEGESPKLVAVGVIGPSEREAELQHNLHHDAKDQSFVPQYGLYIESGARVVKVKSMVLQ